MQFQDAPPSPQLTALFAAYRLASGKNSTFREVSKGKSRRNMHMPLPGMVDHPVPNLYKPLYNRVYGWLDALVPERGIPNHVEQIIGKAWGRSSLWRDSQSVEI